MIGTKTMSIDVKPTKYLKTPAKSHQLRLLSDGFKTLSPTSGGKILMDSMVPFMKKWVLKNL